MDEILQLINDLTQHANPVVRQAAVESAGKVIVRLLDVVGQRRADEDWNTSNAAEEALDEAHVKLRAISQDWRNE